MKRHLGGSTTKWQKPLPVKVAWQSVEGAKNNPTPTAQSILGASGEMSAASIVAYLNQSGEMDYYIEFVKGMDLKTIVGYVGANIYLKTFGVNQVLSDPFADGLLHALGGAVLEKALPGLPSGIATGDNDEDARVAFAKSRIEQGLNLPSGSLRGYGWDNIFEATGKRHLETSLGIPSGYFDKHTLEDAKGLKMAGVNVLADALKLPNDQKAILERAVKDKKTPSDVRLDGVPAGNTIDTEDLKRLFSADPKKQKELQDSLKTIGLAMVREAAKKAVKNKYSGLTNAILEDLLNPQKTVKLGDLTNTVGASTMGVQIGVDDANLNKGKVDIKTFVTRHGNEIATFINMKYSINDRASQINAGDLAVLFDGKNLTLAEKLGGVQVDKAFGWNAGSTFAVIGGKKKLADATKEIFANYVGTTLGLKNQGVSLEGNVQENYGIAVLSERLGIDQKLLKEANHFGNLMYGNLTSSVARRIFRINSTKALSELTSETDFWEEEGNVSGWKSIDIALGTPIGTVRSYIHEEISTKQLARKVTQGSLEGFTADKIYDYFGISNQFKLSAPEINALIKVFKGRDDQTLEEIETAASAINRLMGRSVDEKANFSKDTFLEYIVAPSSGAGTKLLLDQGLRLIAQSIGVNLEGYKFEDFAFMADQIKAAFGGKHDPESFKRQWGITLSDAEQLRQEYSTLKLISPDKLTAEQKARLDVLERHGALQSYLRITNGVGEFFLNATGIPIAFRTDAEAFITGDWRLAIAATPAAVLLPQINEFMPKDNKFSYAEMRAAFIMDDQAVIQLKVDQINSDLGIDTSTVELEDQNTLRREARRQLMDEAQKSVEYRMSDSLLRKIDPSIPVGFSRIMWSGTPAQRGELLQNFAFSHLDIELGKLWPGDVPGTLQAIYLGGPAANEAADKVILSLIGQSGVSFGSFSTAFVGNFYQFIRGQGRGDFFTNNDKYGAMWGFFDKWIGDNLNIGDLPSGLAKSLYYTAINGWNTSKDLKDSTGKITLVQSLDNMGKDFLISRLSSWGDKKFGLQAGKVYEAYKLYASLASAQKALTGAKLGGNIMDLEQGLESGTSLTNAKNNYSQAKAALIMFAIELALSACKECQAFFGSVDQAIAAPPGFAQAMVVGLIANSLKLGPTGIYIAAAIYLFGVYKVEYLCPMPPQELYAMPEYDSPQDQFDYGIPYKDLPEDTTQIRAGPNLGEDKFAWADQTKFTKGDNQKIWMGW